MLAEIKINKAMIAPVDMVQVAIGSEIGVYNICEIIQGNLSIDYKR